MTRPAPQYKAFSPERDPGALAEARTAVMITAFRIGPVLSDTILSALSQQQVGLRAVLLVVDGCPEVETTRAISQRYLAAYPGLFHVLWLKNGGVSRARNRGLQWLMDCHPDLDAIYCLDGDDLISTTSVASSLLALRDAQRRHPNRRYGWVVANKLNFGDNHQYIETPESFRRSSYLAVNLSQPSCLYNADMFRDGLRWDETMRSGVEDWEFWLAAIKGDYEGVFNPRDLLYYRRLMGNRSSVNRRNDAYNLPYMRQKHAPLFRPQAVLADEQACTPRYAFGPPDARAFGLTSDPAERGRTQPLHEVRNALAGRQQRAAPQDYVYDPYTPDIFCVIDDAQRAALDRQGLLRGVLMAAEALMSPGIAIVECIVAPLTPEQRERAGPQDSFIFNIRHPSRPPDWLEARRSFFIIRPSRLEEIDASRPDPDMMARLTRRLLLRSDALEHIQETGYNNAALLRLISRLIDADAHGTERQLGAAQSRSGRLYVSSGHVARHAPLTMKSIGTGPLFPQLSVSGHRRVAMILPPGGLLPAAQTMLQALADHLGAAGRISLFALGNRLPHIPGPTGAAIENVATLAPWLARMDLAPRGHNVGVRRWDNMPDQLAAQLTGVLAPFDEVVSFDLQIFAPVMFRLKALGVNTVSCEPDPACHVAGPLSTEKERAAAALSDDPVAALNFAAAYRRIICTTEARADLLSAMGYPRSRIDLGPDAYLDSLLPGLAEAAE